MTHTAENTIKSLRSATGDAFAISAYQRIDGDAYVVGKYCRCDWRGDHWDVCLLNNADLYSGLTQRKVRSIHRRITEKNTRYGPFTELDGEGLYHRMPHDVLLSVAPILGIKMKRMPSEFQLQALNVINARKEKPPVAAEGLVMTNHARNVDGEYTAKRR